MTASAALPLSPLPPERNDLLRRLVDGLDAPALHWLSGYAAALASQPTSAPRTPTAAGAAPMPRLSIVYGSQTGNARRLAEQLGREAEGAGLAVRVLRADAYPLRELKAERLLYVVISTQGDGDPPDDARAFVEHLTGKRAPALPELKFAVLGLGDSSYPQFCAVGRALDARLAELGATRATERGDADLDIDGVASPWMQRALQAARDALRPGVPLATVTPLHPRVAAAAWTRERPFAAPLLANQRISARDSGKDIRHIELSLEGSGLHYEPGDALGVWAHNDAALVEAVLQTLHLDGERAVRHGEIELPLRAWLTGRREITRLARPFVAAHATQAGDAALQRLLAPEHAPALAELLATHQLIDLLRAHPALWSAEGLVAALRPLTPRAYSIASSQKVVGDEVHLTVAHLAWQAFDHTHHGVASHYLATRSEGSVPVFVEPNERFRLPSDPRRDVIMIGPGTGVAPFRAFVQERRAVGAPGRHWLFFGNPHFRRDFLYQLEWQQALKDGALQRLDLAFSRDQADKVYVQHVLRRRGRELFDWLEQGAHLYVCGDAARMARDVHSALLEIVAIHGARSGEDAAEYLAALQRAGRYARDVY